MRAVALAVVLAACSNTAGVIDLELTTAPSSPLLDQVQHLRLTLTSPPKVVEADRNGDGFDLALDVQASGVTGALVVEGFDAAGALIACGQSPPFPVAALNAHIVVYMAPPMSIELAPEPLAAAARPGVTAGILPFGVIFAGGADATGAPSDGVAVYNAYDHSLEAGLPLPSPRSELQMGVGSNGAAFMYGGFDAAHAPTATYVRFDTNVAPSGAYTALGDAGPPRAGERAVAVGINHFLVTGSPVIELRLDIVTTRADITALPRAGATAVANDGTVSAVFAGADGIIRFRDDAFATLSPTARLAADAATLPGENAVVIAGGGNSPTDLLRDVLFVDAGAGTITQFPDALITPRANPSVAATPRHVIIAGGVDAAGAPIADAEVLELPTFAHVATIPYTSIAPITTALPNDQVLLEDAGALHLFTPPPP